MKRILLIFTLPLLVQLSFAANRQGSNGNQSSSPSTGFEKGHEWVDLGLPSGNKWATCNIGASTPEEYGDYFAWAETSTKVEYTTGNWKYKTDAGYIKYETKGMKRASPDANDNRTILDLIDDAAHANWGGLWLTPSKKQWEELEEQCTWSWTGNGYRVTGPNGQSIFLPAAGYQSESSSKDVASRGLYWTCVCDILTYAYAMVFDSEEHSADRNMNRVLGLSVRPFIEGSIITDEDNDYEQKGSELSGNDGNLSYSTTGSENGHGWVDLGLPSGTKWATYNIGAADVSEPGELFAWGEISTKTGTYNWEDYRFRTSGNKSDNIRLNKYITVSKYGPVDNITQLEPCDDAAHVNWGGNWHIPTVEQWEELINNCKAKPMLRGNAIKLTGPNGQSICLFSSFVKMTLWNYWSASICVDNPTQAQMYHPVISFGQATSKMRNFSRYARCSIRPVTQ